MSQKLSIQDRLTLIQTLNALPRPQFDELVFAIKPPKGNVPDKRASQSDRSQALLKWIESPIGPGIHQLQIVLDRIIAAYSCKAEQFMAIVIKGTINSSTTAEVQSFVQRLKQEHQFNSIDVEFFTEDSIKIILKGSPEELERLQNLVNSGDLELFDKQSVQGTYPVERNTTDGRKAQLIQVLKLRQRFIVSSADIERYRQNYRIIYSSIDWNSSRQVNTSLANEIDEAFNHAQTFDRTLDQDYDRASDLELARDIGREIDPELVRQLTDNVERYSDRSKEISRALKKALKRAQKLEHELREACNNVDEIEQYLIQDTHKIKLTHNFNLKGIDLRGANLKKLDLRDIDISDADFTNADVTGTIFGNNPGLTKEDKEDFIRRGAIFDGYLIQSEKRNRKTNKRKN